MQDGVDEILEVIGKKKEFYLKKAIEDAKDLSLKEWGEKIWQPETTGNINNFFVEEFEKESAHLNYGPELIKEAIKTLLNYRVIQTASHNGLSQLPRFVFNHYILAQSRPTKAVVLSGFYSDIPVGNTSYPGSLVFSSDFSAEDVFNNTEIIKQINKRHLDRIRDKPETKTFKIPLYQKDFFDSGVNFIKKDNLDQEILKNIKPALANKFNIFKKYDLSDASTIFLADLESKIFKTPVLYFDFNRLASRYLIQDFKNNIFWQNFFWSPEYKIARKIIQESKVPVLHQKTNPVYRLNDVWYPNIDGGIINTKNKKISNFTEVISLLEEQEITVSTFLAMSIFCFQLGIRSLGSFRNIEYVNNYQNFWEQKTTVFDSLGWQKTAGSTNLSTGQFPKNEYNFHSFDYFLGKDFNPDPEIKMKHCYLEMANIFKNSPRAGDLFINF